MERKEAIKYVKTHLLDEKYNIEALTTLIPELAESEGEKIREAAKHGLQQLGWEHINGIKIKDILAWLEKQGEQKRVWSEEDENGLGDALWCCKQAASIAKDENDMGNIWFAKDWLKSLKGRVQPQQKQDEQMIAKGERKNIALSIINYLDDNRVEGCMDLSSMECEDLENAVVNSDWGKVYRYMRKKLEKQDERNSNYIHITQEIIDYINKHKAKFENDTPKLGDIWYVKEIHPRPGNPIVELENDKGAWMNLPLHVVSVIQNYSTSLSDPSSD